MIIDDGLLILALQLLAAGICGFGLGGMSLSRHRAVSGIGWFVAGLLVGVVLPAFVFMFYPAFRG